MIVMILERVPPALRGELTRWLIEPHIGTFVGHVSALVREKLWWKCLQSQDAGGVIQMWSTNAEQRFAMRRAGDTDRTIVDFDGLQLIRIPHSSSFVTRPQSMAEAKPRAKRRGGALVIKERPKPPDASNSTLSNASESS
jgi:CRISPR-associated protein Cas2